MTVRYRCGQCNELSLVCVFYIEQLCIELKSLSTTQKIDNVTLSTIQFIGQILTDMNEENQ